MTHGIDDPLGLWATLVWPLARLLAGMAAGLLLANILEALHWLQWLGRRALPLLRLAHLGGVSASAFTLAFVSPATANALLAEKHDSGEISQKELILANLFNSLPASLSHMPTIFFLTWPVLGYGALVYGGLSLGAAALSLLLTAFVARLTLPTTSPDIAKIPTAPGDSPNSWKSRLAVVMSSVWKRFQARMPRLVYFTVPFYILVYLAQRYGLFQAAETWLATNLSWLSLINPQAMGIVILRIMAEMGATLGAAGAMLAEGQLTLKDVVIAMLVGNVLATPLRALRHQLPVYAGFYKPALALRLIVANQTLRASCMSIVILLYALA